MHALHLIFPPLLSLIIITLGNSFFNTATPVWLAEYGHTPFLISVVAASYSFGQLFVLFMERLLFRIGHIRLFATHASIMAGAIGIQAFFDSIFVWILSRFVMGVCIAAIYVVIESWLLMTSTKRDRGRILAIYMTSLYSAISAGQWIRESVDMQTKAPFLIAVIFSSLSIIPLGLTRVSSPKLSHVAQTNILSLCRRCPLGSITCLIAGMTLGTAMNYALPEFAREIEMRFPSMTISLIIFSFVCGGLLLQYPIGYLSDLFDRRSILVILCFSTSLISLILMKSLEFPAWFFLIILVFFGGLLHTIYPLGISHVSDRLNEEEFPKAISTLVIVYGFGAAIGPPITSKFVDIWRGSFIAFFFYSFFSLFLLGIFGLWNIKKFKKVPMEEQGKFISIPSTPSFISDMDPRSGKNV